MDALHGNSIDKFSLHFFGDVTCTPPLKVPPSMLVEKIGKATTTTGMIPYWMLCNSSLTSDMACIAAAIPVAKTPTLIITESKEALSTGSEMIKYKLTWNLGNILVKRFLRVAEQALIADAASKAKTEEAEALDEGKELEQREADDESSEAIDSIVLTRAELSGA